MTRKKGYKIIKGLETNCNLMQNDNVKKLEIVVTYYSQPVNNTVHTCSLHNAYSFKCQRITFLNENK